MTDTVDFVQSLPVSLVRIVAAHFGFEGFEGECSSFCSAMAEAPKPEEIIHPPMDQLQGLEYCIDSNPSWGEMFSCFLELLSPLWGKIPVPIPLNRVQH